MQKRLCSRFPSSQAVAMEKQNKEVSAKNGEQPLHTTGAEDKKVSAASGLPSGTPAGPEQKVSSVAVPQPLPLEKSAESGQGAKHKCCQCLREGLQDGRQHGKNKWHCTACNTLSQLLRRHLGSNDLEGFDHAERADFFRATHENASSQGRYGWKCVRSSLVKSMTEKKITEEERRVSAEELPLSVWISRGFEKSVVLACPAKEDPVLGQVYAVPIRAQINREIHQQVEEELLLKEMAAQEKIASKKRKAAGEPVLEKDWDVAEEVPSGKANAGSQPAGKGQKSQKSQESSEAARLKAEAKANRSNEQQAALAAKGTGAFSGSARQVGSVLAQCDKVLPHMAPEQRQSLTQAQDKLQAWLQESTDFLQIYEKTKGTGAALKPLSYSLQDLKDVVKATASLLREFRGDLNAEKERKKEAEELRKKAQDAALADAEKTEQGNPDKKADASTSKAGKPPAKPGQKAKAKAKGKSAPK